MQALFCLWATCRRLHIDKIQKIEIHAYSNSFSQKGALHTDTL